VQVVMAKMGVETAGPNQIPLHVLTVFLIA
jgi:hypothetical protein